MSEALDKVESLAMQVGYEQGARAVVNAISKLMAEALLRGEIAIDITTLSNVCMRELRR